MFKNGDFNTKDKERSRRPKVYDNADLEELLNKDSCQTQEELALTLKVTQQAVSHQLKSLEIIQKQGHWVPHELTPRNIEHRFCTCEMLLARQKQKGFLHRIVNGDEKWIYYDNPKKMKLLGPPGHASTSTAKQIFMEKNFYCLLKPNETITGSVYRTQLMRSNRALKEKRAHYYSRHDEIIFLHYNARSHVAAPVKTYLQVLNWEVLLHPPYSPDIASSDFHFF
ncbi:hypothetical protein PUN28_013998 [Cardiocondyla obscurior]|uniref:Mariner Mos1 transposase n=1 Tax=Cardiocondyla obscurior TaxID=286306 RepID=A0AAW2F409_9HYME